jgi:hypothetical protein
MEQGAEPNKHQRNLEALLDD